MKISKIVCALTIAAAATGFAVKPASASFNPFAWLAVALIDPTAPGSRALIDRLNKHIQGNASLIGHILAPPPSQTGSGGSQAGEETASSKRYWNTRPGFSGLAGGDEILPGVTLWTALNYSSHENDFAATASDGDTTSISIGVDKQFTDRLTIGLFGSHHNSDTDTPFNGGDTSETGITAGVYGSYMLTDIFRTEISMGHGVSEYENRVVAAGVQTTGTQNGSSWFASASLNADHWIGDIGLGGRIGYLFSDAEQHAYVDSAGTFIAGFQPHFEQVQVSGQVSYYIQGGNIGMLPYVRLEYLYDVSREKLMTPAGTTQPANDRDEIVLGVGLSLFSDGPLSGGIGFTKSFARDQIDSWSLSGNLSYSF